MTWDISGAKVYLGLPAAVDPVLDPKLQAGLDTALALAETYCNRKFMYASETATFHYPFSHSLQLSRYPLEQVISIAPINQVALSTDQYQVILGAGQIQSLGMLSATQIDITYSGGYKVLPPDLLLALWGVFGQVYGAMSAGGGGTPTGQQIINSITVPDVGTIRYEPSGSSTGGVGSVGLIPANSVALFNLYRLMVC